MFDRVFDVGHLACPETAVLTRPAIVDELDRDGVVIEAPRATVSPRDDQFALLELPQVVHDADAGRVEVRGELADRAPRIRLDEVQDAAARGVPERVEDGCHVGLGCHVSINLHMWCGLASVGILGVLTHEHESNSIINMSKRLQVLLEDSELREIKRVAAQHRMTVAEWVRQALRQARAGVSTIPIERKLMVVREAMGHAYPTADIEQMNAEIERGYGGGDD